MATVTLTWTANDPGEQVTSYRVYQDGAQALEIPASPAVLAGVTPGQHTFEVAAMNLWGEGPKSDPLTTPPAASKPVVTILVSVP